MQWIRIHNIILLGLCFTAIFIEHFGIVNGGGYCKPGACDKNVNNYQLSSSSIDSVELCKNMCCNTSDCQMIIYGRYPSGNILCRLYRSHGCVHVKPFFSKDYFCYKDCGDPPTPAHGTVTLTPPGNTTVGSTATRECNPGYELVGTANISCKADGLWDALSVSCILRDCGDPPTPAHGTVKMTPPGNTTVGSTATRGCNPGYELVGTANISCIADGLWDALSVSCILRDCGDPPTPAHGTVILTPPGNTTVGSTATQECNPGYELVGASNISCIADGLWNALPVSCILRDCGRPVFPVHGTVVMTIPGKTEYGSMATQACNPGYDLRGTVNISCREDGNWSAPPVNCSLKDCGLPAVPGNGGIALDSGVIIYGATATRKCSPGYVPVGLATVHCKIDGAWAVRPFICFLEDNGAVKLQTYGKTTFGSSAAQFCDIGHDLAGTVNISCGIDGSWSHPPVSCTLIDCDGPPILSNGIVNLTTRGATTYKATAKIFCNKGYTLHGNDTMMCNDGGMWIQDAECIINDCYDAPSPSNGTVNLTVTGVTTYQATAKLCCNIGYSLNGNDTLVCNADGTWILNAECIINDCKTPEQPANGEVELTIDLLTTYGATAVVTCNTGYELRGDGLLLCKSDGVWGALPSCYIKDCNDPPAPSNGTVNLTTTGVTTYKAIAKLYCNIGYSLYGNDTMMCKADGMWSQNAECSINDCKYPEQPANGVVELSVDLLTTYGATALVICNTGYELKGDGLLLCKADGLWSTLPYCNIKVCKTPEQPANGEVELTVDLLTTYGATAVVTCNTGYELRGDGVLSCKSDGVWSALPSCYIKDCNNPPAPSNGTVNLTTTGATTYKATAKLYCNIGYSPNGNDTMMCKADGMWSQNAKCSINDCKTPGQPANGVVELSVDLLTTYGATAHVTCNTGYELKGDVLLLCKSDGLWSTLPSCNIKAYIPAVAASCGAVGLGIASVAGYWFGCRRWMKALNSVSASNSSDSNKEHRPDHEQSTDGITPDVEW